MQLFFAFFMKLLYNLLIIRDIYSRPIKIDTNIKRICNEKSFIMTF